MAGLARTGMRGNAWVNCRPLLDFTGDLHGGERRRRIADGKVDSNVMPHGATRQTPA